MSGYATFTRRAVLALGLLAPLARAERPPTALFDDSPKLAFDMGSAIVQPTLATTLFSTVDTWNAQNSVYHYTGRALGAPQPIGVVYTMAMHLYPLSVRAIGLAATTEIGALTDNMSAATTTFGPVDQSTTLYTSMTIGPEAQLRFGDLLWRAGALGGFRYTAIGDFNAWEPRIAGRSQVDWVLGGERDRGSVAFTMGLFGTVDVYPALGWSAGASITVAAF
jgi:hypothetical protein